jgi:outer membrane protein assembly factor BamB
MNIPAMKSTAYLLACSMLMLHGLFRENVSSGAEGDWLAFRGTDNTSQVNSQTLPVQLTAEDIKWSVPLTGRGLSSPIIINDKVIISSCEGFRQDKLLITCYSTKDGKQLWKRTYRATGNTASHVKTCNAAPTPASDGKLIVASFSSNDVICVDTNGKTQWVRGLTYDAPNASNSLGMSSSPIIVDGVAVCMVENDTESFTVGIDLATGVNAWKIDRPKAANWTSPYVYHEKDKSLILLQSSAGVDAVDPKTGKTVWAYLDGAATIPSGATQEGIAFIPSKGVTAVKPGTSDPSTVEIVWKQGGANPGTSSLILHNGVVYAVNNGGVLVALKADTGDKIFQFRMDGKYSGTPIIAGEYLYAVTEEGVLKVVHITDTPEKTSELDLKETILCSPASDGVALYVRSDGHLWKIGK